MKPITDQKSSGRCWIYATLNMLRIHFCRQHNLEEFEFSETYLYFWDKVWHKYIDPYITCGEYHLVG